MFFVPEEEVQTSENNLQERFSTAKTISGTQCLHRVIPINNSLLKVLNIRSMFVYEHQWWIGIVKDNSEEHEDYQISFWYPVEKPNSTYG